MAIEVKRLGVKIEVFFGNRSIIFLITLFLEEKEKSLPSSPQHHYFTGNINIAGYINV